MPCEPHEPPSMRPDLPTCPEEGAGSDAGRSRREFFTALGGAVAASALSSCSGGPVSAQGPETSATGGMVYRTLGRTGLKVSEIGFGSASTDDPDVVRYALDKGITYVDTSHCYLGGASEKAIGEALRGRQRDQVVLATKWCPHHVGKPATKAAFLEILDTSLRRLGTDHVDIVLNHQVGRESDGQGVERLKNPELHEAFQAAKQAGKVRFLGVSGHNSDLMDVLGHAIDSGQFDVILGRYSFLDYPQQMQLIERAHGKGVGVVAMKTLAGAKGADLDKFRDRHTSFKQAALKWVLSNQKLSNLIISITSRRQVDEYVAASGKPLSAEDQGLLHEYQETFTTQVCRYCGECQAACPEDVRIADILRFSMYFHEYRQENRALESYAKLISSERAAHCAHCAGHCGQACGYDLPIRTLLLRAHESLSPGPRRPLDGLAADIG